MRNGKLFAAKIFCFFLALAVAVGMGQALSNWRIDRLDTEQIAVLEAGPAVLPDSIGTEELPAESLSGSAETVSFPEPDSGTASVSTAVPESSAVSSSAEIDSSSAGSIAASSAVQSSTAVQSSSAADSDPLTVSPPTPVAGAVNPYSCWYYDRLTADQQLLYCEMYALFSGYEQETEITPTAVENVAPAFTALHYDHPELFWLDQYVYHHRPYDDGSGLYAWKLERRDYMDRATRDAFAVQIEQEKNAILAAMDAALPANASQTAKAQFLFEYLALNTTYVTGSPYNQSMASCLVNRESVCAGYARAYQYILSELGIFCTYIGGYGHGEAHAWSLVQLDGGWYYSDSTWGDTDEVLNNGCALIAYEYFAQSYDWFCLTHTPDEDIWPRTTATAADWFRRNGALLESWDEARVEQLLRACAAERRPMLQLCFTTAVGWQSGLNAAADPAILDLFARVAEQTALVHPDTVSYNYDDERLTLIFPLTYES